MNNPAQYLLQLFEAAERDNGQTFTARDSSAAMAETQTRDKSRWQKFKEEKAGPFMQAFLGLALPNILSAAQLVLQITQG